MLNPLKPSHRLLAKLMFCLPGTRRRYIKCMQRYAPIAAKAFPDNPAATLLVVQALEQIEARNIDAAQRTIEGLRKAIQQKDTSDGYALWHVLHALQQHKSNHLEKMAANLKSAEKYGHRFHMAYTIHGEFYFDVRHDYDLAEEKYLKAIDCLYDVPRHGEQIQQLIGVLYASIADCRTMMHRYDDAKDALRIAEQMHANPIRLNVSRALYYAATGQPAECRRCLDQTEKLNGEAHSDFREELERILAGQHPHFTRMPMGSQEEIAAFWQYFLANEEDIAHLLRDGFRKNARNIMGPLLWQMDPYKGDWWGFDPYLEGDTCHLMFVSRFSRTYTPFVDALIAACPEEIRQRWTIVRKP